MLTQTENNPARSEYSFEPSAMLPAWLVTDENWIVKNWNPLAEQLIERLYPSIIPNLKSGTVTIGEVDPQDPRCVSLWGCLFNLEKTQQQLIEQATHVMAQHVDIFRRYRESSEYLTIQELLAGLRSVQGVPGVVPYVYDRCDGEKFLRIGIRIAPRGGLKLRTRIPEHLRYDQDTMTHVEIALAYKVRVGEEKGPARTRLTVDFEGSQPAIHDSTERSQLEREMEDLRVTSHITHALMTPLTNVQSIAQRIYELDTHADDVNYLTGRLLAQCSDVHDLARLFYLTNRQEALQISACLGTDPTWPIITPGAIRNHLARALLSVFYMKTNRRRDVNTVKGILNGNGLNIPAEHDKRAVEAVFYQLADRLVSDESPVFFLTAPTQSPRPSPLEAAELAKTAALQLILTELIVNAVRHSDRKGPDITFQCLVADTEILWTVENTIPTIDSLSAQQRSVGMPSGARRGPLGRYLNQKFAELLGWRLDCFAPRPDRQAHRLFIPLVRG